MYTFRTHLRISEDDWDKDKERPANIYLKRYKKLNTKLDKLKKDLSEYIRGKRLEKKVIQQRTMSREIQKICSDQKTPLPQNSLLYYMQWYIDGKREIICHSTYKRYKVFYHLLERFEGDIYKRLYVQELNSDFIRDFMKFGKVEEYSENTIYRTIHFVKTILNFVEREGIRTQVRELELRREKPSKQVVTLNEKEIAKIEQTEVPKELQAAKDWLLISCYTGQRFSDFMRFSKNQLKTVGGKECLSFIQQKTKKDIILPLHPKVLNVIKENRSNFPKSIDNQLYNEQIKEIARYSGIIQTIKVRMRMGFRTKEVEAEKWEALSSHIGRRSFATNFYGKIPTPLLMEATGHSTEQMFQRYVNSQNEDRIVSLSRYFESLQE